MCTHVIHVNFSFMIAITACTFQHTSQCTFWLQWAGWTISRACLCFKICDQSLCLFPSSMDHRNSCNFGIIAQPKQNVPIPTSSDSNIHFGWYEWRKGSFKIVTSPSCFLTNLSKTVHTRLAGVLEPSDLVGESSFRDSSLSAAKDLARFSKALSIPAGERGRGASESQKSLQKSRQSWCQTI